MEFEANENLEVRNLVIDEQQMREEWKQDVQRLRAMADEFLSQAVDTMDHIRAAMTEGRKNDALREIDILTDSANAIHAETLARALMNLKSVIVDEEESPKIEFTYTQTLTVFQGTINLLRNFQKADGSSPALFP